MFKRSSKELSEQLKKVRVQYVQASSITAITSYLRDAESILYKRTQRKLLDQIKLLASVKVARLISSTSDEAIANVYDLEYGSNVTPYGYATAILSVPGYELITGLDSQLAPSLNILDVGAGSNEFLRFCRDVLNVPVSQLRGSDVSSESKNIIEHDGFTGYLGRVEKLGLAQQSFDLVYLSYFIDYDTDQTATFSTVIDITKTGGRIVLEGLFPVRPFGFLDKDKDNFFFVTKGKTVTEDILLVMDSFVSIGRTKGRKVVLERVVESHRFVNSHYGLCRLPSYYLTFVVLD